MQDTEPGRRWRSRGLDGAIVLLLSVLAAALSRPWSGFNSPDSEFYASLALFGDEVAARSIDPAYTWTRLGYIAPVRLLTSALGPWAGFALWRLVLIVVIVAALYWIVRQASTRELAVIIAGLGSLNTMVLSYVGNPYLTGTIIAATMLLLALATWGSLGSPRRPWLPPALSGLVAGWLVMLNPYALLLGMTMWIGVRLVGVVVAASGRWRALGRDALAGVAGFAAAFGLLLAAGLAIFPGRNWFQTYLAWNAQLDYASFVGDPDVWQRDVALLVPVASVLVAVIAVITTRAGRYAVAALVIAVTGLAFTWGYVRLVPGPWLEAPHYVAKLWSGALISLALAFASMVGRRRLGPPAWAATAAAVPFVLWAGRWDATITVPQGLLVLVVVVATAALAAVVLRTGPARVGAVGLVLAIGVTAIGAQVLQNGRGLLGIYGQYPFRAAYVDFDYELLMRSKVAAEEWVLSHTTTDDTVGIWTDVDRLTSAIAAMQLWGAYNNVSGSARLTAAEAERLEELRPSAIAMYAPEREQIDAFWSSLPVWSLPSEPECTTVPYLGIGSPVAHVCITHLTWQ